jgi:hypothetical protein
VGGAGGITGEGGGKKGGFSIVSVRYNNGAVQFILRP